MSIKDIIEVLDNTFEINWKEKGNHVKTNCKYNKNNLELEIVNNSIPLGDDSCVTKYKFKIIDNKDTIVKFVEEHLMYKYVFHYKYESRDRHVRFIGFSSVRLI